MRITIVAVGTKMPAWVEQGTTDYIRRMPPEFSLKLVEVPVAKRGKNADINRARRAEGEHMLAAIPDSDTVIALDVDGRSWSTEQLAQNLQTWQMQGCDYSLLVGGPDGLDERVLARAQQRWSLSALTLPHPLVRIILAEQLYRAYSILINHPYHRA